MKAKLSKMLIVAVVALSTVGCVRAEMAMSGKVFQMFEFGNDGKGEVHDVRIQYGSFVIPTGTANSDYKPSHMMAVSESLTVPIPESAKIHWISADSKVHDITAPIRSFVENPQCFYGFRFFFVDEHVDIYVLNRTGDCSRLQGVERTKVFSSKPNQ